MNLYIVLLWMLVALVTALAFAIETGLAVRHKRVVLSTMASATLTIAGILMLGK